MENVFSSFPLKMNPIVAVGSVLILAYVPHLLRRKFVDAKLKDMKSKHKLTIATSRVSTQMAIDGSPEGLYIASLVGCHTNGLEAFTQFSAAVIFALITKVPYDALRGASGLFLTLRTVYTVVYLNPKLNGVLRSLIWFTSMGVLLSLGYISAMRLESLKH